MEWRTTGPQQAAPAARTTLARAELAARPRRILEGMLEIASAFLAPRILAVIDGVERDLFESSIALNARDSRGLLFASISELKRIRSDLVPHVLIHIEESLAAQARRTAQPVPDCGPELALLDTEQHLEESVLDDLATRTLARHRSRLVALAWRMAVVAECPPFNPDGVTLGPRHLLRAILAAFRALELSPDIRLKLLKRHEGLLLGDYPSLLDSLNALLAAEGVLPGFDGGPQPSSERDAAAPEATPRQPPSATAAPLANPHTAPDQPSTAWPGEATRARRMSKDAQVDLLKLLQLATRASHAAPTAAGAQSDQPLVATREELLASITQLQSQAAEAGPLKPGARAGELLKELMQRLAEQRGDGTAPDLSPMDRQVLGLVDVLFERMSGEVREQGQAVRLINRLQAPYARFAIEDSESFFDSGHAAHAFLNGIAETDARWRKPLGEGDPIAQKVGALVERIVRDYSGDTALFEEIWSEFEQSIGALVARARLNERKHVDAARGREKIALARLGAEDAIASALEGGEAPRLFRSIFTRAWRDVLMLTALRCGLDSAAFEANAALGRRLAAAAAASDPGALPPDEFDAVADLVHKELQRTGITDRDARLATSILVGPAPSHAPPDAARDLDERLAAKPAIGAGVEVQLDCSAAASLDDDAQVCLQQIKFLPYGTWFEWVQEDPGQPATRLRMAWFSVVTGHAMFVNELGQRVAEHPLTWMANEMARGRLTLVSQAQATPLSKAWGHLVERCKAIAGGAEAATDPTP